MIHKMIQILQQQFFGRLGSKQEGKLKLVNPKHED